MTVSSPAFARARRAYLWIGVAVPLLLTVAAVTVQLIVLPNVPDPVAVHWTASGGPDGFAAPGLVPALSSAFGVGVTALLAMFVLLGSREGEWGPTMRFLGAIAPALVGGLLVAVTWSFTAQAGRASAADAGSVVPAMIGAGVVAVILGVGAWYGQPRVVLSGGTAAASAQVAITPLAPGERVMWVRTTALGRATITALVGGALVLFAAAGYTAATGGAIWPILLTVALVVTVAILATAIFRVRVDDKGLQVTSLLGFPRFRVPLSAVTAVRIVSVNPVADFGGWGVRKGLDGRTGVVLRRGEALEVSRTGASTFVVTVDDAATAAGVLEALRARAVAGGRS